MLSMLSADQTWRRGIEVRWWGEVCISQLRTRTPVTLYRLWSCSNWHVRVMKPIRPQTGMATNQNGHRLKRPQTGTATDRKAKNWNGHKPKRPQAKKATRHDILFIAIYCRNGMWKWDIYPTSNARLCFGNGIQSPRPQNCIRSISIRHQSLRRQHWNARMEIISKWHICHGFVDVEIRYLSAVEQSR